MAETFKGSKATKLETKVVPTVSNYIVNQKRFVGDTKVYVKTNKIEFLPEKLNSFHKNMPKMLTNY